METLNLSALPLFAAASAVVLAGRFARITTIRSFNNSCDVSLTRARTTADANGTVDAYLFRGTNATARGVARETGLSVFALGGDRFVAANVAVGS